ncbi:MAG: hypothetical protein WCD00_04145 [Desulfuromonadaceae bacterium]
MPEKSGSLHWLIALVFVVLLLFSSGNAEVASAGEGSSTQPAPATQTAPEAPPPTAPEPLPAPAELTAPAEAPAKQKEPNPAKTIIKEISTEVKKDVDKVHESLEQGILEQVIQFDNFFGNPKLDVERKTGYQLHLRSFVRVEKMGVLKYGESLRANVSLSRISERLRIYITGENTPEASAPRLPEDPGNPTFDRPVVTARLANTELRFGFLQTPSTSLFLGAGFTLVIPPVAFVRSRIQHTHHINDVTLLRFGETLFVNNVLGPGETSEFGVEHMLSPKTLLRLSTAGTLSFKIQGMDWGTELALLHQLSSKSAITLAGGVNGNTSLNDFTSRYWLLARYRRNFLRSWLFYELVPEISWPRQTDGRFPTNYAMTFVLEVVFKGSSTERGKNP